MLVGQYSKSIVMILAAGLAIFTAAVTDGVVTPVEIVNISIAILTAVGVYLIPNLPAGPAKYAKALVGFGGAAAAALVLIVANLASFGDVPLSDWLTVLLAGLGAIGLYVVPNTAPSVPVTEVGSDILR